MPLITIWTEAHRPFIMGGDVNAPCGTEVDAQGPFDAGHGVQLYSFTTPSGKNRVAEATTGAIIGDTVDGVRADIASSTKDDCWRRIAAAAERRKRVHMMDADDFWSFYEGERKASKSRTA